MIGNHFEINSFQGNNANIHNGGTRPEIKR